MRAGRAFWIAGALAIALILVAGVIHRRGATDDRVVLVALDPDNPSRERVGDLLYRGGIDIPRMDQNIGGLSALRWDEGSGSLVALTDDARWVWFAPVERDGQLVGVADIAIGALRGLDGASLTGKAQGDSESLTRSAQGGWLVGFERDHRIWRYPMLSSLPKPTEIDPVAIMGPLEANGGAETLAVDERALFLCAESERPAPQPNCFWQTQGMAPSAFRLDPPEDMLGLGAVPTDADMTSDGRLFVLFRSYTPDRGNTAGILVLRPDDADEDLAVLRAPLTVDNFEGLAVREAEDRTFLYIVSDDNFSSSQRTLLMKFEVLPDAD
ncbi:MAG: esterase-like activity of phytase family protein [Erythrobacter sp.]|uniref:esterase-like activity of phytase family protein n=1 Tax=Erythrobacter sp. TaxID=1042 RepID=UPI00261C2F4E|nr:esterase-like activity of phytase family protein [Erythrobacter sp.]MDJ0979838.1 esterase-like activity of phytase family protein [Erythrobacter sp.]